MLVWWNSLTVLEQVFACIAIAATVVLVIQSILLLLGIGFGGGEADAGSLDTDFDADIDADFDVGSIDDVGHIDTHDADSGLSLFTIRGLVAFFAVGGWTGLALVKYIGPAWAVIVALVAGLAALIGIAYMFKAALKVQDKGNLDIRNAVGKTGKVYLPIPPREGGQGKVTILLQERLVELDAVTKAAEQLKTGELVRVCGVVDEQTVLVELPNKTVNNTGGISKWIQS